MGDRLQGWFRTLDQQRIDPLTVTDSHTRFLIELRIAKPTIEGVRPCFERAFAEYGLPLAIRCDNGAPFGSQGAGGLTKLSGWWLKTRRVEPHFIRPASPQENGRHERMHRHTQRSDAHDLRHKMRPSSSCALMPFRQHYNSERPHEALGQRPPAEVYTPSPRALPRRVEDPWYDGVDHQVRRIRTLRRDPVGRMSLSSSVKRLSTSSSALPNMETGDHVVCAFATSTSVSY